MLASTILSLLTTAVILASAAPVPSPSATTAATLQPREEWATTWYSTWYWTETIAAPTSTIHFAAAPPTATPTTTVPIISASVPADAQASYLSEHNNFRAKYAASPLVWNEKLASAAQTWADRCHWGHSKGAMGSFGENLSAGTGGMSINSAIKMWTDEAPDYNAASPNYSHFTQVVWKGAKEIGCAVSTCMDFDAFGSDSSYPQDSQYYVCEYDTGNVIGQFAENVEGTTCTNC